MPEKGRSLTPQERAEETSWVAMKEGLVSGAIALVPAAGALALAMRNPRFVKATNWQSRTALVIMPTLFAFGYTSENKLIHRMDEMAQENEYNREMARYTTSVDRKDLHDAQKGTNLAADQQLTELYRQSVEQSGVRVVPGDSLGPHHKFANFWQENPFKILACLGVPTVAYIFYGKSGQEHIPFQLKVMQTRVMGQGAVIGMLLTLMGFKEYMDRNGKFITETEANARVEEMKQVRAELIYRMELDKQHKHELEHEIEEAHEQDVKEGQAHDATKKKPKTPEIAASSPAVVTATSPKE
jgi:phosphoribosylformylglycinamidine (FGAM) synthase PurS component